MSKSKGGRPSKFKEKYCKQAYKLCQLGATDKDLAEFFNVHESTINQWKLDYPQFSESLKKSKADLDAQVEKSLFSRAMGYKHNEDKIFNHNGKPLVIPTEKHYPPDTTACIFWLKNRQPDKWREKQEQSEGDSLTDALNNLADKLPS